MNERPLLYSTTNKPLSCYVCETAADVLTQVWIVVPAILIYQSSVKAVSAIAACSELNSSKKVS